MAPVHGVGRSTLITTPIVTASVSAAAAWAVSAIGHIDPAEHGAPPGPATWWLTASVLALQCAVLSLLPRVPRLALLAVAALPIWLAIAAPSALYTTSAIPVLVAAFITALVRPFRRVVFATVASAVLLALGQLLCGLSIGRSDVFTLTLESVSQAIIVIGLPSLLASAIAANRAAARSNQVALEAMARERDAQIGEAIALERTAMARELHDIAAHHLSGISLMASAIARQVMTDPVAARTGAQLVREQSNAVLDDLRSLVGLLRQAHSTDGYGAPDGSIKSLATVDELVSTAQQTGVEASLQWRPSAIGTLGRGISPLAQLAAYRMIQEALTNAARHAPGSSVLIVIDDTEQAELRLTVANSPVGASREQRHGAGFGLIGMRERATLIGGSFDAGATADGGWEAKMRIPRDGTRSRQGEHR